MPTDLWTLDVLVEAYKEHERRTRGLRERTLRGYEWNVRLFVRTALGDDPVNPAVLGCGHVAEFIASMSERLSPASMRIVGSALRSFFRYLRVAALCDQPLEAAIPVIACWRLSALPRFLSDDQLKQVLASLETCRPYGLRDRAIVLSLATLGLRPGKVASLCLDDIDWREGVVRLRQRKTRRGAVLPLPREAGRAIVAYLREERPSCTVRRVFVQHRGRGRGRPISAGAVSEVVARALRRAHVDAPIAGAYVFRHTVASRMVQRGASLKEVADVLGHRDLDSAATPPEEADLAMKEAALKRLDPPAGKPVRFKASDRLLAFLESL